jgi:hypothetical protein
MKSDAKTIYVILTYLCQNLNIETRDQFAQYHTHQAGAHAPQ